MGRYVVRRLLQAIPVFIGTTFIIYVLVWVMPGDPIATLGGNRELPESVHRELAQRYNLDDPVLVAYGEYVWGLLHGDFGQSFNGRPVGTIMLERWPVTAKLALTAWLFELVFGLGLGVLAAVRRGKFADIAVLVVTTLVIAVPVFVLGYSAQLVFGVRLDWFPISGADEGWPVAYLMPGAALGGLSLAYVARLTRTSLVENLRADYVRTAVAKGLSKRRVVGRHALRNSLIPVVTYLGVDIGSLMGGAIVIEGVFNLNGIGQEVFDSVKQQEGAVVVGIVTFLVLVYVFANLIVDLLYGVLDPRIRYD